MTRVLCFDIASGGLSGARFDAGLRCETQFEVEWSVESLTAAELQEAFCRVAREIRGADPPDAIALSSFMHSFLLIDAVGVPQSPVFTWLSSALDEGVSRIRERIGDQFHKRTGCRYHPMFPVFKLATMRVPAGYRVVSPKAWLAGWLTASFTEDYGMAAATGLWNIGQSAWDGEILSAAGLLHECLPRVAGREEGIGAIRRDASLSSGIPEGTPVANGSGDGFLATLGSGCEAPGRLSVTLGTSAVARQRVNRPVLEDSAGTFCYQSESAAYLLGCAGSNGGNALDWARRVLGPLNAGFVDEAAVPVFLPMLHGERSTEWDPSVRASWHDITSATTVAAMKQSVIEGVVFNLARYVEILQRCSGEKPREIVLSGNGFLQPELPSLLASLVEAEVKLPSDPGLATLRGAAMCAWRAVGQDCAPAMERIVRDAVLVFSRRTSGFTERYARYKELKRAKSDFPPL